jgi:ribonuclease HII
VVFVAGIDEAGRGPLAGPVTAACVVLPDGFDAKNLTDSKKLSPAMREKLFPQIQEAADAYSIVSVGSRRIDALNIREATRLAMRLAAQKVYQKLLSKYGDTDLVLLIDGNMNIGSEFIEEPIVKGDSKIKAIAAASILAKVARDRLMLRLDEKYADYGFKVHKGYPTVVHKERVRLLGPSRVHRLTFRGVKEHISPFQRS